jgi:hypothetical protein
VLCDRDAPGRLQRLYLNFNNADVLCVQHEFGIYGGPAGSHLLALLKEVRMPVVTTLHTVLRDPNAAQRQGDGRTRARSDRLVVMARKGAEILRETYRVPDRRSMSSPWHPGHAVCGLQLLQGSIRRGRAQGAADLRPARAWKRHRARHRSPASDRAAASRTSSISFSGATHPHLVAREGERYRLSLERLAEDRGVKEHVIFYNRFVSLDDLKEFIGATDIYLTPYLNEAQITSGTLAYVFGAGKAVVSTPYWHAQELLAEGRGVLVPFRNPQAITEGVCEPLGRSGALEKIRHDAYAMGREMIWPAVAQRYLESFQHAPRGSQSHAARRLRRVDARKPAQATSCRRCAWTTSCA